MNQHITFQFKLDVSSLHKEDIFRRIKEIPGVLSVEGCSILLEKEAIVEVKEFLESNPVGNVKIFDKK